MNGHLKFLALALVFFPAAARASEVILLKNGDRISGDVTVATPQQVQVETGYGTLDIPRSAIGGMQNSPVAPVRVAVRESAPPAAQKPAPQKDKKGLWGAKWSGDANLGINWKTGNSVSKAASADGKVEARWAKYRTLVKAAYNHESNYGVVSVNNRALSLTQDYFFRKKWFWRNKAKFEQDSIQSLNARTTVASSLGYQAYDTDALKIALSLGPGYINENFENAPNDNSATANWTFSYLQKFYGGLFSLFHNDNIIAPTNDWGAYVLETASGLRVPIRYGIIASTEADFNRNDKPPPGKVKNDTAYFVKLGYEW